MNKLANRQCPIVTSNAQGFLKRLNVLKNENARFNRLDNFNRFNNKTVSVDVFIILFMIVIFSVVAGFVLARFSYISFKTEDALTARVSVYHASRGRSAVSSDYVLPDPCIRQDGDDSYVFTVITDRNNGKDNILLRYTVEKKSSEDGFSVVSGGFPADSMSVCFSSTDFAVPLSAFPCF